MSEAHESAPQNEDTPQPDTNAPQADTAEDTGVVDYRSRFNNLLPEFTRKSQRLAELEAEREQWLSQQPQYDDDDEDYEFEEFDPAVYQRIAREEAKAVLAEERRREAEIQAEETYVNNEIKTLEKELGENFSDQEWDYLGRTSEALRDESGKPDVRRAYENFNAVIEGRKKKWTSGKRSARPASGPGAAEVVDLDDPNERANFIDQVMDTYIPD